MQVKKVAEKIEAAGLPVAETVEPDYFDDLDGEVKIDNVYHVQVGDDYLILVRWDAADEAFYFGPSTTLNFIIAQLQGIFNVGGKNV